MLNKDGSSYRYGDKLPALKREPAIYRWALTDANGNRRFLVGETDNLRERIGSYLNSGYKSHREFRNAFERARNTGGSVGLETLRFEPFSVCGIVFSVNELYNPFIRLVLENLCCAQLVVKPGQLLNAASNKWLNALLEKVSTRHPEKFKRIVGNLVPVRQGTASAVPQKPTEEGGFSR